MLRIRVALALAAGALGAAPAHAAEITSLPPWLRGDIELGYAFDRVGGSLYEGDTRVGSRTWEEHALTYSGTFSAGPGVAVFFELPQYLSTRLAFPEANSMVYDPSQGSGTMVDTETLEGLEPIKGAGVDGLWLGIKGTPFSEDFESRGNRATWLIEGALQTRSQNDLYTITDEGDRGGGLGGGGLRLGMAFSTTHHISQPYMAVRYTRTRDLDVSFYDEDGSVLVSGAIAEPADRVDIRAGTEIIAHDNPESSSRFSIDLRLGFGYRTWQSMPSGLYLPSVLTSSRDIPVTESEHTWVSGGVGFYHQAFEYMQWKLVADATYLSPHRVEHPYSIDTGTDTLGITVGGGFKVMVR